MILIDNGHFQYNCISLGLAAGAAMAVIAGRELLACVLFSLSLNHKQMSAYYAPAFFAHLLGRCLQKKHPLLGVFRLGCTVLQLLGCASYHIFRRRLYQRSYNALHRWSVASMRIMLQISGVGRPS